MFFEIGVVKIYAVFTGKQLYWSLFLIKLQGFRPPVFSCEYCEITIGRFTMA